MEDNETAYVYKEGQGQLQRPVENNHCYYSSIIGNWSRDILHGKRIEYRMNLDVFPVGYYRSYVQKNKAIKSLHILNEMKKGVHNGPATIIIDGKKACRTSFIDQIEYIKSSNHPIGRENMVSTDRALLNCLLVVFAFISIIMVMVVPDGAIAWISISVVLYTAQIVEGFFS